MHTPTRPAHAGGFSLIEVMVGLAIGMATVVIMLQMLANSDAMKRTASGGNDAQMTGTLALYTLERDIRASGYGISAFNILGCELSYTTTGDSANVTVPLAPTTINPDAATVPAGDAHTDTLLVVYGNSDGSSEGDALIATSTPGNYRVAAATNFKSDDRIVAQTATRPTPCSLSMDKVTQVDTDTGTLTVTPGVAGLATSSVLYNLGQAPVIHAYAVRNGNLTMCDYAVYDCGNAAYANPVDSDKWVPIAGNIVSLVAQYGRDTTPLPNTMLGVVDSYDQVTPASDADLSGNTPYCAWARTLAVRMAVVARSASYNKETPTTEAPTWSGSDAGTAIDLSGTTGWQHYRYKTLETTVPLRNSIWQGGQATYQGGQGC